MDEQGYKAIERSYGSFYRTVPLPQKVNLEKLTTKMQDGVLQITVPLDESARPSSSLNREFSGSSGSQASC